MIEEKKVRDIHAALRLCAKGEKFTVCASDCPYSKQRLCQSYLMRDASNLIADLYTEYRAVCAMKGTENE